MLPLSPERLEELKNEQIAAEQLAQLSLQSLPGKQAQPSGEQPEAEGSQEPQASTDCSEAELLQAEGHSISCKSVQEEVGNGSRKAAATQPKRKSKKSGKRAKG